MCFWINCHFSFSFVNRHSYTIVESIFELLCSGVVCKQGFSFNGREKAESLNIQVVKSILVIALSLAKSKNMNIRYCEISVLQFVTALQGCSCCSPNPWYNTLLNMPLCFCVSTVFVHQSSGDAVGNLLYLETIFHFSCIPEIKFPIGKSIVTFHHQ